MIKNQKLLVKFNSLKNPDFVLYEPGTSEFISAATIDFSKIKIAARSIPDSYPKAKEYLENNFITYLKDNFALDPIPEYLVKEFQVNLENELLYYYVKLPLFESKKAPIDNLAVLNIPNTILISISKGDLNEKEPLTLYDKNLTSPYIPKEFKNWTYCLVDVTNNLRKNVVDTFTFILKTNNRKGSWVLQDPDLELNDFSKKISEIYINQKDNIPNFENKIFNLFLFQYYCL